MLEPAGLVSSAGLVNSQRQQCLSRHGSNMQVHNHDMRNSLSLSLWLGMVL